MTRLFLAIAMFLISFGAVYLWIWITTGTQPPFDIISFITGTISSVFCMVWYFVKYVVVLIVNVATDSIGLGTWFSYPSYNC